MNPLVVIDGGYIVTTVSIQVAEWSTDEDIKDSILYLIQDLTGQLLPQIEHDLVVALDLKLPEYGYYTGQRSANYKAGRKPNPMRQKVAKVLGTMPEAYGLPGLEADQIAGTLVRFAAGLRKIYLLTVDTDWYQLQDDGEGVVVVDLYRTRWLQQHTDQSVCKYYQSKVPKKSDFVLNYPADIVKFKHLFGDKSDNLQPGQDLRCYQLG